MTHLITHPITYTFPGFAPDGGSSRFDDLLCKVDGGTAIYADATMAMACADCLAAIAAGDRCMLWSDRRGDRVTCGNCYGGAAQAVWAGSISDRDRDDPPRGAWRQRVASGLAAALRGRP